MNPKISLSEMPQVTDAATAEAFIRWCCRVIGFGFHPDTPFGDYEEVDGTRTFTDEDAARLDAQMEAAFKFVPDPYRIGLEEFAAMRSGPPLAEAGPVESTTTEPTASVAATGHPHTGDSVVPTFLAPGTRVRFKAEFDIYPFDIVPAGATGTVVTATADLIAIRLDDNRPALAPWDNEAHLHADQAGDEGLEAFAHSVLEPLPPA
jgi:hypothetical protein